ncbi:hypothetical protein [Negadavirga shengliensis]|uniref:Uncharacterized protein n=1 Tax=Negadavirga shengliensis TaxID=1389218 RepID=A0ABV9T358_9BACT
MSWFPGMAPFCLVGVLNGMGKDSDGLLYLTGNRVSGENPKMGYLSRYGG